MNKARKKQFFLFFYCFIMTKYLRLTVQNYKKVREIPNKNEIILFLLVFSNKITSNCQVKITINLFDMFCTPD